VPQPALAYPPHRDGKHQGKGLTALRPHSGAKVAALSAPTQWRQHGARISGL